MGAELTAAGDGRLYGFFPVSSSLTQIHPRSARVVTSSHVALTFPTLGAGQYDFAVSFWGGLFFFYTAWTASAASTTRLSAFDPATQATTIVVPQIGFNVVGAGSSTCVTTHGDVGKILDGGGAAGDASTDAGAGAGATPHSTPESTRWSTPRSTRAARDVTGDAATRGTVGVETAKRSAAVELVGGSPIIDVHSRPVACMTLVRGRTMKSRAIWASIGHGWPFFCLVACAGGGTPTAQGVTSEQPENVPDDQPNQQTNAVRNVTSPNRCQPRGSSCETGRDCCTEWCDNGVCTLKSVR